MEICNHINDIMSPLLYYIYFYNYYYYYFHFISKQSKGIQVCSPTVSRLCLVGLDKIPLYRTLIPHLGNIKWVLCLLSTWARHEMSKLGYIDVHSHTNQLIDWMVFFGHLSHVAGSIYLWNSYIVRDEYETILLNFEGEKKMKKAEMTIPKYYGIIHTWCHLSWKNYNKSWKMTLKGLSWPGQSVRTGYIDLAGFIQLYFSNLFFFL